MKISKILRGSFEKKLDFDRKKTGFWQKLDVDRKTKLDVEKKIKKERASENTVFTPTRRQKPTHKSPTAAGMREHNRSPQ